MSKKNTYFTSIDAGLYGYEDGVTLADARRYTENWKEWENEFTPETLQWVCSKLNIMDIAGVHYVPEQFNRDYWDTHYEREDDKWYSFEEYMENSDFHRSVRLKAVGYRVPKKYQNVGPLKQYYKDALLKDYPYLNNYDFESYVPSYGNGPHEIYVKLTYTDKNGNAQKVHLYTPVKAFKEKNSKIIYDRHFSYNADYYKTQPEWRAKMVDVLDSEEYKTFAAYVDGNIK